MKSDRMFAAFMIFSVAVGLALLAFLCWSVYTLVTAVAA